MHIIGNIQINVVLFINRTKFAHTRCTTINQKNHRIKTLDQAYTEVTGYKYHINKHKCTLFSVFLIKFDQFPSGISDTFTKLYGILIFFSSKYLDNIFLRKKKLK